MAPDVFLLAFTSNVVLGVSVFTPTWADTNPDTKRESKIIFFFINIAVFFGNIMAKCGSVKCFICENLCFYDMIKNINHLIYRKVYL